MKNQTLIKCLGLALAATMAVAGCDSGGGGAEVVDAGATGTGGGNNGGGANTGGGSNAGLNATGNGGGGTSGTGTSTGGTSGTGTSTGGTSTTGTSTGGTTGGNFLATINRTVTATSLNNPTQMVRLGNRIFFVDGFGLGANNGRLYSVDINTTGTGSPVSIPVALTASPASTTAATLDSPFGIATDGTDLFLTVGFGISGDAAIIRVSDITTTTATFTEIATDATFITNPAFLLVSTQGGTEFVYWSEYVAQGSPGGRIRRARTDGTGTTELYFNGLNFPAGIATDGTRLVICDSDGGADGQVIIAPMNSGTTLTPTSGTVSIVTPATGQQAIGRPFEVTYDGVSGFFFTEGNAIEGGGAAPLPLGPGNGTVRYIPRTSTTASLVSNGLNNCAGIAAASLGGTSVGVLFSESVTTPNGRVLRRVVDTANVTNAAPSQVDTGLARPIDVVIGSSTVPVFGALINYQGGQANGLIKGYAP